MVGKEDKGKTMEAKRVKEGRRRIERRGEGSYV